MARIKYTLLPLLFLAATVLAKDDSIEPIRPTIQPSTSSVKPITTSTTTKPTTPKPTAPPITTTPKPTPPPITTTPKPTPPPNTTTTTPPSTTTTIPTTTTIKPTPPPTPNAPEVGTWFVNYTDTNRTCLVVQISLQLELHGDNKSQIVNIPKNATSSGNCSNIETLKITWGTAEYIQFFFEKENKTKKYELGSIDANITCPGHNATESFHFLSGKDQFSVPLENSYKCFKEQTLNLTNKDDLKENVKLHISHVQFQAFKNATTVGFDSAIDCAPGTPDVVPIAVGCVLAALVVMVLVAYLVGRRRCQARGYLSM